MILAFDLPLEAPKKPVENGATLPKMVQNRMIHQERLFEQPRYKTGATKVLMTTWNPKQTVVALAMSNGEIVVKRHGWHTCWRQDVSEFVGLWFDPTREPDHFESQQISSICFSPDGEYLVVNMANGRTHFFSTNTGRVAYTTDIQPFIMMKWIVIETLKGPENKTKRRLPTHTALSFINEGSKEPSNHIKDIEQFFLTGCFFDYRGTMLIGVTESSKMFMYANGLLLIKELNLLDHYKLGNMADPHSLTVIDFAVIAIKRHLNVIYQYTEVEVSEYIDDATDAPIKPSAEPVVGTTTILADYDLGWNSLNYLRTIFSVASNYSQMIYCIFFLKEALRYTTTGFDEASTTYVERIIEITIRNYKLTTGHRDSFFYDMIKHIKGEAVSIAYIDSIRKLKSHASLKTHMAPFIDFTTKRLNYIRKGINIMMDVAGHLMDIAQSNVILTHRHFEARGSFKKRPEGTTSNSQPNDRIPSYAHEKARSSGLMKEFFGFLADIATFQWQLDRFSENLDLKRSGMIAFNHYLHEFLSSNLDTSDVITVDMGNHSVPDFLNFITESQRFDTSLEFPSRLIPNVFKLVPHPQCDVKPEEVSMEVLQFLKPIGVYEVPKYFPRCTPDCSHVVEADDNPEVKELLESAKKKKVYASVYQWHTEKFFDFFSPYFAEFRQDGLPSADIAKLMREKLHGPKPPMEYFKRFVGPEVPKIPYVDNDELIIRMAMRPTFYLGMWPLFDIRNIFDGYYSKKHPRPMFARFHCVEKAHPNPPKKVLMTHAKRYHEVKQRTEIWSQFPRLSAQTILPETVIMVFRNSPVGCFSRTHFYFATLPSKNSEAATEVTSSLSSQLISIRGNEFPMNIQDVAMNAHGVVVGLGPVDENAMQNRETWERSPELDAAREPIKNGEHPVRLFWMDVFGKSVLVNPYGLEIAAAPSEAVGTIVASPSSEHGVLISDTQVKLVWIHTFDRKILEPSDPSTELTPKEREDLLFKRHTHMRRRDYILNGHYEEIRRNLIS